MAREFIAGLGSAGDRPRSLSIDTLSLKAGPNEISGLLPCADEWLAMRARLTPFRALGPMAAQVGRWRPNGCQWFDHDQTCYLFLVQRQCARPDVSIMVLDAAIHLPLPLLRLPGARLGSRRR
jgi:hypothetical protein